MAQNPSAQRRLRSEDGEQEAVVTSDPITAGRCYVSFYSLDRAGMATLSSMSPTRSLQRAEASRQALDWVRPGEVKP